MNNAVIVTIKHLMLHWLSPYSCWNVCCLVRLLWFRVLAAVHGSAVHCLVFRFFFLDAGVNVTTVIQPKTANICYNLHLFQRLPPARSTSGNDDAITSHTYLWLQCITANASHRPLLAEVASANHRQQMAKVEQWIIKR